MTEQTLVEDKTKRESMVKSRMLPTIWLYRNQVNSHCSCRPTIRLETRSGQYCPGGEVDKNLPTNAGDMGLIPGPRRSHMLLSN